MDGSNHLSNRVCLVTGSNSGIGKAAASGLARLGATVVMVCRSLERGRAARDEVIGETGSESVDLMLCDLSSQRSIRQFAAEFKAKYDRLHVLINNAANFDHTLRNPMITEDGVETIFATNHLGPFLLTHLLLDLLKASAPARILNVASKGLLAFPGMTIEFDNLNGEKRFSTTHAYYHSKMAQIMFTYELARRLQGTGVTVNCIRVTNVRLAEDRLANVPGILQRLYAVKAKLAITPERMASTYIWLATSPEAEGISGKYFDENRRTVKSSRNSYDEVTWRSLWQVSERLTGLS